MRVLHSRKFRLETVLPRVCGKFVTTIADFDSHIDVTCQ